MRCIVKGLEVLLVCVAASLRPASRAHLIWGSFVEVKHLRVFSFISFNRKKVNSLYSKRSLKPAIVCGYT